jgi:hypothetical protein
MATRQPVPPGHVWCSGMVFRVFMEGAVYRHAYMSVLVAARTLLCLCVGPWTWPAIGSAWHLLSDLRPWPWQLGLARPVTAVAGFSTGQGLQCLFVCLFTLDPVGVQGPYKGHHS